MRLCPVPYFRAHDLCDLCQRTSVEPFQVNAEISTRWSGERFDEVGDTTFTPMFQAVETFASGVVYPPC
eukprot:4824116-Pyramimonas_sp.AAC.1